jgi:hypothetical protein
LSTAFTSAGPSRSLYFCRNPDLLTFSWIFLGFPPNV